MSAPPPLEIRLFGPLTVQVSGAPLPRLRSRKGHWLLALLTLRAPNPVERGWLAGMLWPESAETDALRNLRQSLNDLRAALGSETSRILSPTPRTLRLDLTGADVDLLDFDQAMQRGDLRSLEAAISLCRGLLLEGCQEEWVSEERLPREQSYLSALETLADAAATQKEYARAVGYLRRLTARDPFRESVQRSLMQALAAGGSISAAIQVYRDLRRLLRHEMNTEPDPETTALLHLLRQEAGKQSPAPGHLSVPAAPPSAISRSISGSSTPSSSTPMIGREEAVREIVSCLRMARLVTLTGTGGVGKTRLALYAAETIADDYAGGFWFVDLAPLTEAPAVAPAVLAAVGATDPSGADAAETLRQFLRSRHGLLLLDNCEHLIAVCAELAEALLADCPTLRILATSREPLNLRDETVWRVPSLSEPAARQLFLERARAAGTAFALTEANTEAVQQICRRLDGIPLALELAAARVKVLSPAQIVARLDDRFRLLTNGSRTALPRQQTLKSTIDWSHALLSAPEQSLFRRLSVFAGGWTVESAEAVCADFGIMRGDVLYLLSNLAERSLIVCEERDEVVRHRFLETIRQYAGDRLRESGEEKNVAARHAAHFLALAEEEARGMEGADRRRWLEQLAGEHDNLRAALRQLLSDQGSGEGPLRLVAALREFWHSQGHWREGRRYTGEALFHAGGAAQTPARAAALYSLGELARLMSDHVPAQTLLEESLALCRELGDTPGAARALSALGDTATRSGDYEQAAGLHEESLALCRVAGDLRGITYNLIRLSGLASLRPDYALAGKLSEESLALAKTTGDRRHLAHSLYDLGRIAAMQEDYCRALPFMEQSIAVQRELGNRHEIPTMLTFLAFTHCHSGNLEAARVALTESLLAAWEMGNRYTLHVVLGVCITWAIAGREWEKAAWFLGVFQGDPPSNKPQPAVVQEIADKESAEIYQALDKAMFQANWSAGHALTMEEAAPRALLELADCLAYEKVHNSK